MSNTLNTETIDRLFFELSQFTTAATAKELELGRQLDQWRSFASYCRYCAKSGESGPCDFDEFVAHQLRHKSVKVVETIMA